MNSTLTAPRIGGTQAGYRVFAIVELNANGWTVAAHCPGRSQPYVTWHAEIQADSPGIAYWAGHYFSDLATCLEDLAARASGVWRC